MAKRGYPKGRPRKYPPIDFLAALEQGTQDDHGEIDFTVLLDQPPAPPPVPYINNNLGNSDGLYTEKESVNDIPKLKDQLTDKEIKFLDIYLSGEYTIDSAMVLAGYGNYERKYRYQLSRKIIEKYESGAEGARKVLRQCGVGEVRVAKKIDALMEAPSERTQLGATELAAKCLGMTQEQRGPTQAIQIIINTVPAPGPGGPGPAGGPPTIEVTERKALPPQTKPLQITK